MEDKHVNYGTFKMGRGCGKYSWCMKYMMELEQEFARLNILYGADKVKCIMKATSCSIFEVEDYINKVQFTKDGVWLFDTSTFEIISNLHDSYVKQLESI